MPISITSAAISKAVEDRKELEKTPEQHARMQAAGGGGGGSKGMHTKKRQREKQAVQITCPVGSPGSWIVPRKVSVNEEHALRTFHRFDRRRIGYFTHKDVKRVFGDNALAEQVEFLQRFDANNDNQVSFDEFRVTLNEFIFEKGDLNIFERTYITFTEPDSSGLAKVFSIIVMCLILVSTLSFVLEYEPQFRYQEKGGEYCKLLSMAPTFEPTRAPLPTPAPVPMVDDADDLECYSEPKAHIIFAHIETICIAIFTFEYLVRLLTVWAARFGEKFEIVLDVVTNNHKKRVSYFGRTWKYATNYMNLVDFIAILPFYIDLFEFGSIPLNFVRVLRLARVFRVFKMGKYSKGMTLLTNVLSQSAPALRLLCFFSFIGMILFGSMVFFCEQGSWSITAEYPNGAYLRLDSTGSKFEPSPFTSITSCFWWVIVTQTTVGYGDQYPTSDLGKVVGAICMVSGILVLALPITIIGANFANEYAKVQADEAREKMEIAAEVAEDAAKGAALKLHGNAVSRTQGESPIGRRPSLLAMQSLGSRKNVFRAFLGGGSNSGSDHVARQHLQQQQQNQYQEHSKLKVVPFEESLVAFDENDSAVGEQVVTTVDRDRDTLAKQPGRDNDDVLSTDGDDSDDEEEDRNRIRLDWVKANMNRKSSALNRNLRDSVVDGVVSSKISTAILEEIADMLECLEHEDLNLLDTNRTVVMLNMCWAWLQKNQKDPASNCDPRQTELLLRSILEFSLSTIAPESGA